jgi:hypothetical protein
VNAPFARLCRLAPALLAAALGATRADAPAFQAQVIDAGIRIGYGLAAADVDGDGRTDLLLADQRQFVWYRNPDWRKFVLTEALTARDHVCLAARDLDGDGLCEIAVGAEWNPGDTENSGAVFFLRPPADRTQPWSAVRLPHEPTTHRMRWVRTRTGHALVVVPLHGRGNRQGKGAPVKVLAYHPPADPGAEWKTTVVQESMHLTHNLEVIPAPSGQPESLLIAGREGVARLDPDGDGWKESWVTRHGEDRPGAGEVRWARGADGREWIATIDPLHGHQVCLYTPAGPGDWERRVLDDSLKDGHALAFVPQPGLATPALAAGWRSLNRPPPARWASASTRRWTPRRRATPPWTTTPSPARTCSRRTSTATGTSISSAPAAPPAT